jgi:hypothetical protein
MADGFRIAMVACAGLAALGGILAWFTISSDVLEAEPEATARLSTDFSCAVAGPPLQPGREARGTSQPVRVSLGADG